MGCNFRCLQGTQTGGADRRHGKPVLVYISARSLGFHAMTFELGGFTKITVAENTVAGRHKLSNKVPNSAAHAYRGLSTVAIPEFSVRLATMCIERARERETIYKMECSQTLTRKRESDDAKLCGPAINCS